MPGIKKIGDLTIRGVSFKGWIENALFCVMAAFFSSLMVIINHLNLPGEVHQVAIGLDNHIPLILAFVPAYLLYFPFVYGGWGIIFFLAPKMFRTYATGMLIIGLITGIVDVVYNTYAARAIVQPTDVLARTLIYLYSLNNPTTALPSLHVSHSICTSYFLCKTFPKLTGVWVVSVVLITLSTLFVKTHYFIDVVISIFLGLAVTYTVWALREKLLALTWAASQKLAQQKEGSNTTLMS